MKETTAGDSLHMPPPPTYIPFDIIPETILCRLPVNSLLRFRCVCKPWDSLISKDTNFAEKHLRMSPKRQHLVTTSWQKEKLTITSCPFDSHNLTQLDYSPFEPTQLDYSPFVSESNDGLIASCDGLLCFAIDQCRAVLYNPSIRKVKKLPNIVRPQEVPGSTIYAFGYDPFIHNYKVVAVFWSVLYQIGSSHSYTLGTDSWKRIKDLPSMFHLSGSQNYGIFVSGTVNWLTYHYSNWNKSIVSLHLGKESYQEIPQPDFGKPGKLTLEVIRDCLCLFFQENRESFIDVWLMKEYGNKESWIKFISFPGFSGFSYHSILTKIIYIYDDDNHVFLCSGDQSRKSKWAVYDYINDTIKSFKIEDKLGMVKSKVYVESLISPENC